MSGVKSDTSFQFVDYCKENCWCR